LPRSAAAATAIFSRNPQPRHRRDKLKDVARPTLRNAGAILLHNVPLTIIKSDWRGLARKTTPNLSDLLKNLAFVAPWRRKGHCQPPPR
jgi:hypothetical protein